MAMKIFCHKKSLQSKNVVKLFIQRVQNANICHKRKKNCIPYEKLYIFHCGIKKKKRVEKNLKLKHINAFIELKMDGTRKRAVQGKSVGIGGRPIV